MAKAWIDSVRQSGQLRVYPDSSMQSASWAGIFERALEDFNRMAQRSRLRVRLVAHDDPPARGGTGGADVWVGTASGEITTNYGGSHRYPRSFDGEGKHGLTRLFDLEEEDRTIKAFVYLPTTPMGWDLQSRRRAVGPGVQLVILAHEFVHCCGLEDRDHAPAGLFQGNPSFEASQDPADDRVGWGASGHASMPPIALDDRTARTIRGLWSAEGGSSRRAGRRAALEASPDRRLGDTPDGLNSRSGGRRPGPTGVA
jgi:hypothetical protein